MTIEFVCFIEINSASLLRTKKHCGPIPPVVRKSRGANVPFSVCRMSSSHFSCFSFSFLLYNSSRDRVTFEGACGWQTLTSKKVLSNLDWSPQAEISSRAPSFAFVFGLKLLWLTGIRLGSVRTSVLVTLITIYWT